MHMHDYATDHRGLEIGSLIYDGFLIRKHPSVDETLLREIEMYTESQSGYKIRLEYKEFDVSDQSDELISDEGEVDEIVSSFLSA